MGDVWNRYGEKIGTTSGKSYTDYSSAASAATPKTANQPWTGGSSTSSATKKTSTSSSSSSSSKSSSSSSKSSSSSSSSSSSGKIDTTGLTGYALEFAKAYNSGMSYDQASQYATNKIGGSGLTAQDVARITSGSSSGSGVKYDPNTGYAIGVYTPQQQVQQAVPQTNLLDIIQGLQGLYQQPQTPTYQQPSYTTMTKDQINAIASEYANTLIDPQVSALKQAWETAQAQAAAQKEAINAAYSGISDRTQRLLSEAQAKATETAIARGMGRSGAVEWLTEQLQTPVLESANTLEAERVAKLNEVNSFLSQAQQKYTQGLQELEKLRGQYTTQQAQALSDQDYARQFSNWQAAVEAANARATLNAQQQANAQQLLLGLLPYLAPTWSQTESAISDIVNTFGSTSYIPKTTSVSSGAAVPVRDYITRNYGSQHVGYDPTTNSIRIGGVIIPISELGGYRGYILNDQAYMPAAIIDQLMRSGY